MKSLILSAFIVATAFGYSSCKKSCHTSDISGVDIEHLDSADTAAVIIQYKKNSNFATALSTTTSKLDRVYGVNFPATKYAVIVYNYDWKITLLPSGKTFAIKNVSHKDEYRSSGFSIGEADLCYNDIYYTVNDSALFYNNTEDRDRAVRLPIPANL